MLMVCLSVLLFLGTQRCILHRRVIWVATAPPPQQRLAKLEKPEDVVTFIPSTLLLRFSFCCRLVSRWSQNTETGLWQMLSENFRNFLIQSESVPQSKLYQECSKSSYQMSFLRFVYITVDYVSKSNSRWLMLTFNYIYHQINIIYPSPSYFPTQINKCWVSCRVPELSACGIWWIYHLWLYIHNDLNCKPCSL